MRVLSWPGDLSFGLVVFLKMMSSIADPRDTLGFCAVSTYKELSRTKFQKTPLAIHAYR